MTTLELTLAMVKTLPEADLVKVEKLIQKLRRERFEDVFPELTAEELQQQLRESYADYEAGRCQNADVALVKLRRKYGL